MKPQAEDFAWLDWSAPRIKRRLRALEQTTGTVNEIVALRQHLHLLGIQRAVEKLGEQT